MRSIDSANCGGNTPARWFRFYHEALDDPKVQSLSHEDFRHWVNLLCLACRYSGRLPNMEAIAFGLRISVDGAETVVGRLLNATLIDRVSGGPDGWGYAMHGWSKRQYKSDTSTERVKRFRAVSKPLHETPPDTDTDTDTDKEKKSAKKSAVPAERASPRGSRLPKDFEVPDSWIEWAVIKHKVGRDWAKQEAEKFVQWWPAQCGPSSRKLDWELTWKTWVARSLERNGVAIRRPAPRIPI
jgi:hypothetical protein